MTITAPETGRPTTAAAKAPFGTSDWRVRGACRDKDPDLFFPTTAAEQAEAERVCAGCPVRQRCVQEGRKVKNQHGVWGGINLEVPTRLYGSSHLPAAMDIAVNHRDAFQKAVGRGLTELEVALELGTNVQTVHRVAALLEADAVGWEGDAADPVVVARYLAGGVTDVHPRERLAAVVEGVGAGMTYAAFDVLHGLPQRSTEVFVRALRKQFAAAGVPFPKLEHPVNNRLLTDAQALKMRVLGCGGVSVADLAAQFNVSKPTVRSVLRGDLYAEVGGPRRYLSRSSQTFEWSGVQSDVEAAA